MYGDNPAPPTKKWQNLTTCKVGVLLCELSDDEDQDETSDIGDISSNPHTPWHGDFHGYLVKAPRGLDSTTCTKR